MSAMPMGDDSGNDLQLAQGMCPMCSRTFPLAGRGIYCGPTCRQRAFRLRQRQANGVTLTHLADVLRREHHLVAQTVYECPACDERFLGERRCDQCHLMCRKVGLGGRCSACDDILTITDLVGFELQGGDVVS
jgi:hypothetical protein